MLDVAVAQDAQFQAASAKVDDAARRGFRTERGEDRFAAQAGFFCGVDHFQRNSGLLFDAANKRVAIAGFAGGTGGHGAIFCDAELIHGFLEMTESLDGFFEKFFAEAVANENTFAETQRVTFIVERFDVERGVGAGDGQTHGVGAGVDGGDVNRL